MNLTNYDYKDVSEGRLSKISEEEARKFIESGVAIVLRTRSRDFYRVTKIADFDQAKRLKQMGVYDVFEAYLE